MKRSRPKPWFVTVRVHHERDLEGFKSADGWVQRSARFAFRLDAREYAERLAAKESVGELYRWASWTSAKPVTHALLPIEAILPRGRRLTRATITWGSIGTRGKTHGQFLVEDPVTV